VNSDDGKACWTFQTGGEVDSSPAICGGKVVVGSEDGRLYMLRLSDGVEIWSYEAGQAVTSSPAIGSGMVVVGCDDGYVYAFGGD
jgi:outer membrane protein assembly factor BamB